MALGDIGRERADAAASLAADAAAADGVAPLSEQSLLHLRHGHPGSRHLLLFRGGDLAGYALLDPGPDEGPTGELVVHPRHRGAGGGLTLSRALLAEAGGRPLRLWAHGDAPAAARLAAATGLSRVRALWQMRRPLGPPLPEPQLAAGVAVRAFRVGHDEAPWLDLNGRAFAAHPEQGAWTRADLDQREQEPWFDPAGFFLAERSERLVGFHWTKIHDARPGGGGQVGEVYVVGVDPAERGAGLGRALTLVGLRHLRNLGLPEVMLYVDEQNTPAVALYRSLGFAHVGTDVMYGRG